MAVKILASKALVDYAYMDVADRKTYEFLGWKTVPKKERIDKIMNDTSIIKFCSDNDYDFQLTSDGQVLYESRIDHDFRIDIKVVFGYYSYTIYADIYSDDTEAMTFWKISKPAY